jgi:hypothetical protein
MLDSAVCAWAASSKVGQTGRWGATESSTNGCPHAAVVGHPDNTSQQTTHPCYADVALQVQARELSQA